MTNDYELGGLLGRGGMGEVHIARHRSGRIVAIKHVRKTLSLDPALCERLTEEARILARIDHPNVVGVVEGGTNAEGQPYLVMARAYGTPLDVELGANGPLTRERISAILSQLFDGLIAIHAAGVIHADLKSSNVLIDELDRVTIIDFGLARVAPCETVDEVFGGTPAYMAPELLSGGCPSIAADIFAAGVIAYELLTNSPPLPRHLPPMVLLAKRMHEPAELPSRRAPERGITPALDEVLARALARNPEERYPTVRELADALAEALAAWEPSFEDTPTMFRTKATAGVQLAATLQMPGAVENDEATGYRAVDHDRVITRALAAASARVAARDVPGAIQALEDGLAELAPADPQQPLVADAWRIETVLAALYQSIGKKDHASRLARVGYQHAQRTGNPLATARANAVLAQVTASQTRIARGSRSAPLSRRKR